MDSIKLRKIFIDFFIKNGHKQLPPASLIPENDPSVLFTTAGMQQFKRFYTHPEEAPAKNVVTCQPCFRTSDIKEVGDETHLTFFEMLGNFSFDGYFKKEAIEWAYEFLTKELGIAPEKIWCSIFAGDERNPKDEESSHILQNMRIRFEEHNRDDNFWGPTGEEGPCGPTVEFYIDNIEVWNLVFNEYYKNPEGTYRPLETKGVDTGMGLERMLVVLNKKNDVFETDLFWPIVQGIEQLSKLEYGSKSDEEYIKDGKQCWVDVRKDFRIIADHAKAIIFLIKDNIQPSNTERGYITRRLIRRIFNSAEVIKLEYAKIQNIFEKIFDMYNIDGNKEVIIPIIMEELDNYKNTLFRAKAEIRSKIMVGWGGNFKKVAVKGSELFDWYQRLGIPPEVSIKELKELDAEIDEEKVMKDFNMELKHHQELSRTASAGMFKGGLQSGGEQETKYHSATHLLLASLRKVLGDGVHQKGSNITAERLRFDFSHPEKLSEEQVKQVEDLVNQKIKENLPVKMEEMSLEDAKNCGAIGEFGEKYGFKVKVYFMGDFSKEICGGPHVERTGGMGHFKIIKEESSSAGVRRIKAVLE